MKERARIAVIELERVGESHLDGTRLSSDIALVEAVIDIDKFLLEEDLGAHFEKRFAMREEV
jgi:hypothetical protein